MPKKITVELDAVAEQYFADVKYSLDYGDGKSVTNSQVINHCLGELAAFEKITDDQLTNWLSTEYPKLYTKYLNDNNVCQNKTING